MQKRSGTLPLVRSGVRRSGVFETLAVAGVLIVGPMAGAALAAPDAAFVLDAKTDKVLFASNADAPRHPASLTKMMTLYMLFDSLAKGKTSLDAKIPVSARAAAQAPSKLDLSDGDTISVRDAILAIVTRSANDVAVAIAEYLGGSEKNFSEMMTARARQMGMSDTTFVNASGLPDDRQITTARDLATLALALRQHFPQYYSYFSTPSFVWRGRRIANHDRLLGRVAGVNGIKTGYTRASGFNLATSVDRNNRMVVGIVLGGETGRERDNRMAALLEKYLPAASRGPMVASIVPGGPRPQIQTPRAKVAAATNLPLPRTRPEQADPAAVAATDVPMPVAAPTAANAASVPLPNPAPAGTMPETTTDVAAGTSIDSQMTVASLIGANSPLALEAVDSQSTQTPAAQAADAPADNVVAAATSPATGTQVAAATPASDDTATEQGDTGSNDESVDAKPANAHTGWRIQIAATDTQAGAEEMLDRALAKAGRVLAHASPYTESFSTGNSTVYRARFAGFSSKETARAACAYLVKRKFACLAVGTD